MGEIFKGYVEAVVTDFDVRDIHLSRPIKIGGIDYSAVAIREPFVEDEIAVADSSDDGAVLQEIAILARCTGLSRQDFRTMRSGDYRKFQAALQGFLLLAKTSAGSSSSSPEKPDGAEQKSGE